MHWGDVCDPDDDNDGLPDDWENQYGLNLLDAADANQDLDFDGLSNLQEYQAGSDPTSADNGGVTTQGVLAAVSVDHNWKPVTLAPLSSNNTVIIAAPPSFHGKQPGVVRINKPAAGGFEIRFQEWDYLNVIHKNEIIPYLILEKGRHTMNDGSIWEVGTFNLAGTGQWQANPFLQSFTQGIPKLFLTIQTANGAQAVSIRARKVSLTGFEAALFEEQGLMDGHKLETIGYLAIDSANGSGTIDLGAETLPYNLQRRTISHQWQPVLASTLKVEEEQSADQEVRHKGEEIDVLALGAYLFAQDVSSKGGDPMALRQKPVDSNFGLEWGTASGVTHLWSTISLQNSYRHPVVVAYQGTPKDADPAVVVVKNVGTNGFEVAMQEQESFQDRHGSEDFSWIALAKGNAIVNGRHLEVS